MKVSKMFICILLTFVSLSCSSQENTKRALSKKTNQNVAFKDHSHPDNPYYSRTDTESLRDIPLSKWKKILTPYVYSIAFEKGTDKRFKGYWDYKGKGIYYCGICGNELFQSTAKFASTCGWPSFFHPVKGAVVYQHDDRYGMHRIEVICSRCGAHLGHVFNDGPKPTGLRYCMNSSVLDFVKDSTLKKSANTGISLNYNKIIKKIAQK